MKELVEALQIFESAGANKYCVSAEHDVICVQISEELSTEQINRLAELGWHQDYDDMEGVFYLYV